MSPRIPIVDFRAFTENLSQSDRVWAAKELVEACRDVGFVYINNHGIPQSAIDQAFQVSKKFYDLPVEEKMKAPHPPGWAVHRGYSWPGLEKVSNALSETDDAKEVQKLREVQDFKESYEVGSENNPDMPNVWPPDDVLPEWRPFMTSFYWTCFETAKIILRALALGLGLEDEEAMLRPHSGHYNQLRLLHYPPMPTELLDSKKFARMPTHSDWSTVTLLLQDACGGLQVENSLEPGTFLDATPVAGTLVLNVGDLLMRWSNDYLKSTQHRVTLPSIVDGGSTGDVQVTRARYSIPFFVSPDPDVVISCMDINGPPRYAPITQREYAAMRARMQY